MVLFLNHIALRLWCALRATTFCISLGSWGAHLRCTDRLGMCLDAFWLEHVVQVADTAS